MNPSQRDERIDALRAFALAGILQVNIQSFVWGAGNPLGYLAPDADGLQRAVYFLLALLAEYKFMPIFGLLFGAGFGLLWDKFERQGLDPAQGMKRRMGWLLGFGLAHGLLLYYGDITHLYALLGLILIRYARRDLARLKRALIFWWGLALTATLALSLGLRWTLGTDAPDPEQAQALIASWQVYTGAGWLAQFPQRATDFFLMVSAIWLGGQWIPSFAILLTGLFAQRAGWVRLELHPRVRRMAIGLGLAIGLPASLVSATLLSLDAVAGPAMPADPLRWFVLSAVPLLGFAYAVVFLTRAPASWVKALAPAGRMPLTNYLLQSLAMGALLSGWGLGWGQWMDTAQLAGLGLVIVLVQWLISAAWMSRHAQGPIEALWRRYTYRGA